MTNRLHTFLGRSLPSRGLRFGVGVLAGLTLLALVALAGDVRGWRRARADDAAMRSVQLHTRQLVSGLTQAESGERGFLLTGHEDYLKPFAEAVAQVPGQAASLENDAGGIPSVGPVAGALAAAARFRLHTLARSVALAHGPGGAAAAVALMEQGEGPRAMAAVQLLADLVHQRVDALRGESHYGHFERRLAVEGVATLLAGFACLVLATALVARMRAERLVRARLEALLENASAGIAIFTLDLRCLHANPPFAGLLPDATPIVEEGRRGARLWSLLPQERAVLEPACTWILAGGQRVEGLQITRHAGTSAQRDWLASLFPISGERRGVGALGVITVEVTAQKAAERRLAFHLQLEEQLRELDEPVAMKHAACSLIGHHFGAAQAAYGSIEEPWTHVEVEGGWTDGRVAEMRGRYDIRAYGTAVSEALMTQQVVAVGDIRTDPRIAADGTAGLFGSRGIIAFAMVLVVQGGHPRAIVGISHAEPRAWHPADLAALRDAANRSWSAVERGRAAFALQESEQQFQRAIAGAGVGVWDWDIVRNVVSISRGAQPPYHDQIQGTTCTGAQFLAAVHADDRARMAAALTRVDMDAQSGMPFLYEQEFRSIKRSGEVVWLRSQGRVTQRGPAGISTRLSGVTVDITERRRAEEALHAAQERLRLLNQDLEARVKIEVEAREQAQNRLAQAQRIEALGQLSAGIAHDFNNVLQAITGSLALVQRRAGDAEVVRQLAAMAGDAAARGGVITTRLLSFARQGALKPLPVQPAPLLSGLNDMLEHMLGQTVRMQVETTQHLPPLLADKAQLEAVLVSLALNARDAMPSGGVLTLSARLDQISEADLANPGLQPGPYIRIAMADTGTGMNPAVLARASEPFFTTKPVGQGTGLGLAMARGFAEQSGGAFLLTSTAGEGTTVALWLPLAGAVEEPVTAGIDVLPAPSSTQRRVLLVDDDALVREVLAGQLEDLGYRVALAQSGAVALARLDSGEEIELMITDYAMPGMNGAVLLAETRLRRPRLPVLLLTGYADESLRLNMEDWDSTITLLMRKPVSFDSLAKTVEILLEYGAHPAASPRALAQGE